VIDGVTEGVTGRGREDVSDDPGAHRADNAAGQGDALPRQWLAFAGGPLGAHVSARSRSWAASLAPLLVAATATIALSVTQRAHCIQEGWSGSDQFWHACFSDLPALYQLGNLDAGLASFVGGGGARADHPVLTGSLMALVGGVVPDGSFLDQTRWYFALWALLAVVLAVAVVALTAASRPRHVADAAQVALSPVLLLAALVSSDLFGVALVSAGIWAWSRRRPLAAGVLLGLAVSARTYPLLVVLALLLLAVRTGRTAAARRMLAGAAGAVGLVLLPFLVANPGAVLRPYAAWWDAGAGLGSPWMAPQLAGNALPAGATTLLTLVGLVVTVGAGAFFALGTDRRPTVAEVALVLVGLALVTGKSFPVQASLWLVPLVALCGVRSRDSLVWAGAEALHFVAVWLYVAGLSTPDRGLPAGWYGVFLTLRVLAVLYLVWRVWHTAARRPAAVRDGSGDSSDDPSDQPADEPVDELAGDFAGAPDRLLVRLT
jgi:Glycosyltransferase family 87